MKVRTGAFKPTILSNVVGYGIVTKLPPVLSPFGRGFLFQAKLKLALLTLSNLLYLVMPVVIAVSVSCITPVLPSPVSRGFLFIPGRVCG